MNAGELAEWNIAHADLALSLVRIANTDFPIPDTVRAFLATTLERPSVRVYMEHPRPPNPPPRALASG